MFRVTSPDGRFVVGGALKAPPRARRVRSSRARRVDSTPRVAGWRRISGRLGRYFPEMSTLRAVYCRLF
jgi:hypothetical protein